MELTILEKKIGSKKYDVVIHFLNEYKQGETEEFKDIVVLTKLENERTYILQDEDGVINIVADVFKIECKPVEEFKG